MTGRGPVLLIDDDPDMRDALANSLDALGYSVVAAEHGADALEKLEQTSPCLILLDLLMPVMDGREFLRRLRASQNQHVPVVLMSANHDVLEVARKLRIEALLVKPFTLHQLDTAVRPHCELESAAS
ncbi:MAG: response regulator [Myxococcaceae bacterium]